MLIFGAVLLLLAAVILLSAVRSAPGGASEEAAPSAAERRDEALAALRALEFDHRTEKIGEEEYHALRHRLGSVAVRARAEAEGLATAAAESPERPTDESPCDSCGAALDPDDRFCAGCGSRIEDDG